MLEWFKKTLMNVRMLREGRRIGGDHVLYYYTRVQGRRRNVQSTEGLIYKVFQGIYKRAITEVVIPSTVGG